HPIFPALSALPGRWGPPPLPRSYRRSSCSVSRPPSPPAQPPGAGPAPTRPPGPPSGCLAFQPPTTSVQPSPRPPSPPRFVIGALKGGSAFPGARQFFRRVVPGHVRPQRRRRADPHIPSVVGRHQQEAHQPHDREQIHDHIPAESFFLPVVVAAMRTIGQRLRAEVGLPTLGTGEELRALRHPWLTPGRRRAPP